MRSDVLIWFRTFTLSILCTIYINSVCIFYSVSEAKWRWPLRKCVLFVPIERFPYYNIVSHLYMCCVVMMQSSSRMLYLLFCSVHTVPFARFGWVRISSVSSSVTFWHNRRVQKGDECLQCKNWIRTSSVSVFVTIYYFQFVCYLFSFWNGISLAPALTHLVSVQTVSKKSKYLRDKNEQ